jgi:glutathione S-transferase
MASPQFTLYSHAGGPNGFKVVYVLEALKLSYKSVYLDFGKQEQKALDFVKLNPNGRIPALVDHHNGDFAIWESDAIMLYLIDTYDKSNTLTSTDPKEKVSFH